jgi:hypothetical protein
MPGQAVMTLIKLDFCTAMIEVRAGDFGCLVYFMSVDAVSEKAEIFPSLVNHRSHTLLSVLTSRLR